MIVQDELDGVVPASNDGPGDQLCTAARTTIEALREQNVIQPWHELDCAIVIEAANGVRTSKGIAKSQMLGQLLAARAKLPDPAVQESDDAIRYEADRDFEWLERHGHLADVPDAAEPAPVH